MDCTLDFNGSTSNFSTNELALESDVSNLVGKMITLQEVTKDNAGKRTWAALDGNETIAIVQEL